MRCAHGSATKPLITSFFAPQPTASDQSTKRSPTSLRPPCAVAWLRPLFALLLVCTMQRYRTCNTSLMLARQPPPRSQACHDVSSAAHDHENPDRESLHNAYRRRRSRPSLITGVAAAARRYDLPLNTAVLLHPAIWHQIRSGTGMEGAHVATSCCSVGRMNLARIANACVSSRCRSVCMPASYKPDDSSKFKVYPRSRSSVESKQFAPGPQLQPALQLSKSP